MKFKGHELTREEAEAYLETMGELELSPEEREDVAGGKLSVGCRCRKKKY